MKKILTIYTGGTICTHSENHIRELDIDGAKRKIVHNFIASDSPFAPKSIHELFVEAHIDTSTLSENMTISKLNEIASKIQENIVAEEIAGAVVLHGTDTLAYSSAIFSFLFSRCQKPIMLVSAKSPIDEKDSNANKNFRTAVELILEGIAPNVYVPYLNSDGRMLLHLGSNLMQCPAFCSDFESAKHQNAFLVEKDTKKELLAKCKILSQKRQGIDFCTLLEDKVLYIEPYTGLNYKRLSTDGIKAIIHGTYHSGTVCVGRDNTSEEYDEFSILYLCQECERKNIPIFLSPSSLGNEQYSSVFDAAQNGNANCLNMTKEAAFAKATIGVSLKMEKDALCQFMKNYEINGEFLSF